VGGFGRAHVFERDASGQWPLIAELSAADEQIGDQFGAAVAIDGGTIVVGAWTADSQPDDTAGAAYVFERDPNGAWTQTATLLASNAEPQDRLGFSVAISGTTALVGAEIGGPNNCGAAYIFEPDEIGLWRETQILIPPDGQNSDDFGYAIAMDDDLALIGARRDDHGPSLGQAGSAYVFWRDPQGLWTQVGKLTASDGQAGDEFGNSVAISGNLALIGAWHDDDNGPDSGSAYVFAVGPDRDGDGVMDVCGCREDLNVDGAIDLTDLSIQLASFGATGVLHESGDLDLDQDIDLTDLSLLLAAYGGSCE
jgi:hypothetical protein